MFKFCVCWIWVFWLTVPQRLAQNKIDAAAQGVEESSSVEPVIQSTA